MNSTCYEREQHADALLLVSGSHALRPLLSWMDDLHVA